MLLCLSVVCCLYSAFVLTCQPAPVLLCLLRFTPGSSERQPGSAEGNLSERVSLSISVSVCECARVFVCEWTEVIEQRLGAVHVHAALQHH